MTDTDFVMVAERPADLVSCVVFASALRRAGHVVETFLTYSKVKKQLARARAFDPSWIVILNQDQAVILDTTSEGRFEAPAEEAKPALIELWDDYFTEPSHPLAKQMNDHFREWMRAQ